MGKRPFRCAPICRTRLITCSRCSAPNHRPDGRLDANFEFYTALLLHGLGFPSALFTPTFAVGRVVGWSAHCLEQLREGRLIRPQSAYVGPTDLHYDRGTRHTRSQ